ESTALRLRTLARDTKDLRDELQRILAVDVLSAVDTIEGVGAITGADIRIGAAVPEVETSEGDSADVEVVGFLVEGEGSLNELLRTISLFETLPLASVVQSVEIERVGSGQTWRIVARIQVLTGANTSL
ncbi:MAG: hypothetical protein Q8P23_02065, partial [bacterium]|nr:hypothetical protein [bacterium]